MAAQAFSYHDSVLQCENVPLLSLAREYGTPLYVYSTHAIVSNCAAIEDSFEGLPHLTTYAVKANSNLRILGLIAAQGFGADVGSIGEFVLAQKAGFPSSKISFSGVGKRDDEIEYALREKVLAFNVESEQEIEVIDGIAQRLGTTAPILLRVNLDIDAGTHAYISTSRRQNKFGVPAPRAVQMLQRAQTMRGIDIRGIHSHIGSQITNVDAFVSAATSLKGLIDELRANGVEIRDLDFGGGFGIQYYGFISHPQIPFEKAEAKNLTIGMFFQAILPILKETGCALSFQPGRSIVANAGVLVTKVLYRKETDERTFVIVDGGMNDLIRPSLYHAHHQIVPVQLRNAAFEAVDVVGPCCESGDFFAQERAMPAVDRGDLLSLMCAGAYGYVLSSNYNARLRPAEVLVDGDNVQIIRSRERVEDLFD